MTKAIVRQVENQVRIIVAGSELLKPLVTIATGAATAAETAEAGAVTARNEAEGFRDEAADRTAEILRIMGRADLYGIEPLSQAAAFLTGGVEVLPLSGYFRVGGSEDTALADMPGMTITRASVGYARTVAGTFTSFASGAARITDRGLLDRKSVV